MRRIVIPVALVASSVVLFPSGEGLLARWKQMPSLALAASEDARLRTVDSLRLQWNPAADVDTSDRTDSVVDPFRLSSAQGSTAKPRRSVELGPPPPRLWKATGRVGERAAVLSHPDGRVQVVSVGQVIDSASVVGIGTSGVELEDRGGRFILRIP
ncbi:MAG TPA: hypothetical protein PKO15_09495 [Fibrobacteria bacterium]|nr:hypothetical protein [Fibrobacteria bacterium]HOX50624.1 hypothetical protein [Fibrobacteria bacterium]